MGYLTVRMLSAGVGTSGRVGLPVPSVRIGRDCPRDATIPTHAPKPRIPEAD